MDISSLLRPQIQGFEPYLPGRSMESVRRERGLRRVIKLASNENPLGPSKKALQAMVRAGRNAFRYPDGASTLLREALARKYNVEPSRLIVGAGSDELIELLAKTFLNPTDSIVVSEHAFMRYQIAAQLMGAQTLRVPMKKLTHDLTAMGQAIQANTKLLFIANPNNPTGTYNTTSELKALLGFVAQVNRQRRSPMLVVVDEAYYEFSRVLADDYPDTLALQKSYPFLVVLRTFSKVYALAGLRVGYGFADPALIQALDQVRPPFNVSTMAQVAAEAALGDAAHVRRGLALVQNGRKTVWPMLEKWKVPVIPSVGNFFLMGVAPRRGKDVFEALLQRGIIVRTMEEYGFPQHIRVSFGLPAENQLFLNGLKEVLEK